MQVAHRTTELIELCLGGNPLFMDNLDGLSDDEIDDLVRSLKLRANEYWSIDPNESLKCAEKVIEIGESRDNLSYIALGKMARGDALKFIGHLQEAWESLAEARELYQSIGDEVGWARACIGPLYFCAELSHVDEALENAKRAREIFSVQGEQELVVSLEINLGAVHISRRDCQKALTVYKSALSRAEAIGVVGEKYVGRLNLNIGMTYYILGNYQQAKYSFEHALHICSNRHEDYWTAFTQLNMASLARRQGRYKEALRLLHQVNDDATSQFPMLALNAKDRMVSCYLFLNRYLDAYNLSQQIVKEYEALGATYGKGVALFNLATLEAELSDFDSAYDALINAEKILSSFESNTWDATLCLWRASIALKTNDPELAYAESIKAAYKFAASENIADFSNALLRQGQALYAMGDLSTGHLATKFALNLAQRCHLAWTRYSSHLLLGQFAEADNNSRRARRHYQAAMATVERVQRRLSLTLRPGFLENKADGFRAMMRLCLNASETISAFETLERVKSLAFLSYLNSRDSLRWEADTPRTKPLLKELNDLRDEHQWYYHFATGEDSQDTDSILSPEDVRHRLQACEKRMRAISEQLYIESHDNKFAQHTNPPSFSEIQEELQENAVLLEYYNDGDRVWVFVADESHLSVHELDITVAELDNRLRQLQLNISSAVQFGSDNPIVNNLTHLLQSMCHQLYTALIQPVIGLIEGCERLLIVPFGNLHYLPFHLLHSGTEYLIEQHEVVILPTASLITHSPPQRPKGALIIGHSNEGKLPHSLKEAQSIQQLLGGKVYCEGDAKRHILDNSPCQVLHIAAHGEFRIDNPDLSFIKLADGQLFTDDLLQRNLSYELITLSACETGLANVTISDELIGLGRSCLYAGAGALLVSLWNVDDNSTQALMESIYQSLAAGMSKAAALQLAQCQIIARHPTRHPAFWGAFQLIGNGDPLSNIP